MSLLETKIASEIALAELVVEPIRTATNNKMFIYGDTDFTSYILIKAIYFALDHAVYLDEDDRLALHRLLKLNTTVGRAAALLPVPPIVPLESESASSSS